MDYCLGTGDGLARMWDGEPDIDLNGDGRPDAIRLDFDGDGLADDVLADLDGDGIADHAVLDLDNDGTVESYFTDDGSGTWAMAADPPPRAGQPTRGSGPVGRGSLPSEAGTPPAGGGLRWFGLDGVEHTGGPLVDFDADGKADVQLLDSDGNGLADRAIRVGQNGVTGYVDTDGDGRWDVKLTDTDGDGTADAASALNS
jgi:hypothetical protein